MEIHPIVTEADHLEALKEIERLWHAEPDSPEDARLDALVTLVSAYEERKWDGVELDPIEHLEQHMQWNGYTQADLAKLLGSRSRASEILNRKRPLTLEMIQKLHAQWGLPATLLIQPYKLDAA